VASLNQPPTVNKSYFNKRYFNEQGLGQHTGAGAVSARTGVAPEASSKNVTKIILTIVFFMFFSCGEFLVLRK
jgi:hypothetical protein